jgi:hypothetical protein
LPFFQAFFTPLLSLFSPRRFLKKSFFILEKRQAFSTEKEAQKLQFPPFLLSCKT